MVNRGQCTLLLYFYQDSLYTVNEETNARGKDLGLVNSHIPTEAKER